jgi:ribosomal protein L24
VPKENRAFVQGVNMVKRHEKPQGMSRPGGIVEKEGPIDLPTSRCWIRRPTSRPGVGFKTLDDGKKVRVAKALGRGDRPMSESKKGAAPKKGGKPAAGGKGAAGGGSERSGAAATNVVVKAGPAAASPAEQPRLRKLYDEVVRKKLTDEFGYSNPMQVPKLEKIVINMGVGEAAGDQKKLDAAVAELMAITGQKPVKTKAKKAIAGLQDPRRPGRSAARSRCARRACTNSWIAW